MGQTTVTRTRKKTVGRTARRTSPASRTNARAQKAKRTPLQTRTLPRFLRILRAHLPDLTARYHIKSLALFGSYVRKDATRRSDLDVLMEFDADARMGLFGFVGLQNELTDLLGVKVDLVEKQALGGRIGENILREAVAV
jgi:predicted nucleotidyltransferase